MDKDLEMIYESFILNRELINKVGNIIKNGFDKGLEIFDIVANHLPEFVAVAGVLSTFITMDKVHRMYQNHPEILKQHDEYAEKAINEIGQFFIDHPEILKFFLKK